MKTSHSNPLQDALERLERQNDVLGRARNEYLLQEASRKHYEATLVVSAPGKSMAEKSINAQATPEWLSFHNTLARLNAIFEFQRLKFDILCKEWQSNYLEMKSDGPAIKKQGF